MQNSEATMVYLTILTSGDALEDIDIIGGIETGAPSIMKIRNTGRYKLLPHPVIVMLMETPATRTRPLT